MPAAAGEDSALCRMLQRVARYFEHKTFLTATPHNGFTQCYTGLLEQLDPVRYTQKDYLTAAERSRAEEIVIRRLKREIKEADEKAGRVPRFTDRKIAPEPLSFSRLETALSRAFESFRTALTGGGMTYPTAPSGNLLVGRRLCIPFSSVSLRSAGIVFGLCGLHWTVL